jgi:hypothetical protein
MSEAQQGSAPEQLKNNEEGREDKPTIDITIDSKGNIIVETKGTTGKQCDLLTGALEARLGEVTERTNKQCYLDDSD